MSPLLPSDSADGEGAGSAGPTFLLYILRIMGSGGNWYEFLRLPFRVFEVFYILGASPGE